MNDQSGRPSATTERILTAARALVQTDGAAELTIRRVARAASVSPSLVIRYFGSRGQLLADVFDGQRAMFASQLKDEARSNAAPRLRIDAVLELFFQRDLEDPGFTRDFMAATWAATTENVRRASRETRRDVETLATALDGAAATAAVRDTAAKSLMAIYRLALAETLASNESAADGLVRLSAQVNFVFAGLRAAD